MGIFFSRIYKHKSQCFLRKHFMPYAESLRSVRAPKGSFQVELEESASHHSFPCNRASDLRQSTLLWLNSPAVVQNLDISSGFHPELRELAGRAGDRFARQSTSRRLEPPLSRVWPPRACGRGFWKFELPAHLLGSLLGKGSRKAPQDGGGQRRFGRRSAVGARLGGLSDLYEPYLLQKEMSGNLLASPSKSGQQRRRSPGIWGSRKSAGDPSGIHDPGSPDPRWILAGSHHTACNRYISI